MKVFFRPPATVEGQQFYTRYASLVPALTKSGYLAQVVSGLTEWGILYALIYSSLAAFWPQYAAPVGLAGATVGVLVVEVGLRRLLPYGARAVIYKRWHGLDRWVSCVVLATAALLLAVSALLSFAGSRSLVDTLALPPAEATTAKSDSLATAEADFLTTQHATDAAAIRSTYDVRLDAVKQSAGATLQRIDGQLATVRTKEKTTGQKFTTRVAELTEQRADAIADRDAQLAALATEREAQLAEIRTAYRAKVDALTDARDSLRQQVAVNNASTLQDHQQQVNSYGGGLAWFTVVCLVVLVVSVVLKELHQAGSGIVEQVEPDAFTFEVGPVAALIAALQSRATRAAFGIVHRIERGTPEAPEPVAPPIIWQHGDRLKLVSSREGVERRIKPLRPLGSPWWQRTHNAAPAEATRRPVGFVRATAETSKADAPEASSAPLTQCVKDAMPTDGKALRGTCQSCGVDYEKRTTWQKFCSTDCRKEHHAQQHGGQPYDHTRKPWQDGR